jgi:hypothetical protein
MSAGVGSEYVTTSIESGILYVGLTAQQQERPLPVASDLTTTGNADVVYTGTPYPAGI